MVLNDFRRDWKDILYENKMTQIRSSEIVGKSTSYISQMMLKQNVNTAFIEVFEKMGYDIKIEYVKREEKS